MGSIPSPTEHFSPALSINDEKLMEKASAFRNPAHQRAASFRVQDGTMAQPRIQTDDVLCSGRHEK